MIFKRDIAKTLLRFTKFPVVAILGPRQSGKTTLARETFKDHLYFTLENPAVLEFIQRDPEQFLRSNENEHGIILDEFQHAPALLSYLQIESDQKYRPGYFILTGSQNFLMNEAISQSLAGRVGILNLLPLSIHELEDNNKLLSIDQMIIQGGYPRIHAKNFLPQELFPSYMATYVERDVRQLINVENLTAFQNFMKLCAGRSGQLLNIADIAMNCGINRKTAESWLSILETSYILFRFKPYFNNFNKRLTKTPKIYFYDTGLACYLLGIKTVKELSASPFRGHLFENFIIADFYKQYFVLGADPSLYFWRDQNGRLEVDCLIDMGNSIVPVEIKSSETIITDFFTNLGHWREIAGEQAAQESYIVYGGHMEQQRSAGHVISWESAGSLVTRLEKARE